MLSAREVGLVAQRELYRNIRSTKGIAMFALFFLGGLVPAVVRMALGRLMSNIPEEVARDTFEKYLAARYDSDAIAKHLVDAPRIVYFLFEGTLMFLPLVILLVGFDQIAGEIQHRTMRYTAGRATRASIVVGKALGIWGVIAVMVSCLHLTVWLVTIAQGGQSLGAVVSWGGRMLLFSIFVSAAYVGFASLMSAIFRTPTVALFSGAGLGFGLWLFYAILGGLQTAASWSEGKNLGAFSVPSWVGRAAEGISWTLPNRYERLLLHPDPLSVLGGLALFLVWGGLCVAGASAIVGRRDL